MQSSCLTMNWLGPKQGTWKYMEILGDLRVYLEVS